jgi:hypothetical protein
VALTIAAVVCIALYRRGHIVAAALLPLVLGGAELLNLILKLSFHRPRPEVAFVHIDTGARLEVLDVRRQVHLDARNLLTGTLFRCDSSGA